MSKWMLALMAICISNTISAYAHPHCSSGPSSASDAVKCAKNEIFSDPGQVFEFAKRMKHLGDIKFCTKSSDRRSYFTNSYEEFSAQLQTDKIQCVKNRHDIDSYLCWVTAIPGCFVPKERTQKGIVVEKACFRIGKKSGQFFGFYPNKPNAACD